MLPRLALAAVRQAEEGPRLRPADRVERAPEDRRHTRVGRVAEHPAELALLDLPGDLCPELEVEALVVDRPGLVRLEVDTVVDVGEEVLERPFIGLEVQVGHPYERHAAPTVGAPPAPPPPAALLCRLPPGGGTPH